MLHSIPVSHIAGVGRAKQKCLADLGLWTVDDVLHHFPFRYDDRSVQSFETFEDGEKITARAVIEGVCAVRWQKGKAICTAAMRVDARSRVTGVWFNQPYLREKLVDGRVVVVTGKYNAKRKTVVVSHTEFSSKSPNADTKWVPVYSVVRGLTSAQMQAIVQQALVQYGSQMVDVLPNYLVEKYKLASHDQAVRMMHQPASAEDLRQAHRRLAFEEFFLFQLQLQWFRQQRGQEHSGMSRSIPADSWQTFIRELPFELTGAQVRSCEQILRDLQARQPMNRLLQGDVGSGKTLVAFWASYAVFRSGSQSALMAPTEILAEQHYQQALNRLSGFSMRVELLTGSTPEKARLSILNDVKAGEVDLLIGTHALLTENVEFARLGLVITDEQHRFGVSQRAIFRQKGQQTDVLFLSATPIPRTLALAVYGDLDVSVLDELPKGRKDIKTYWLKQKEEDKAIRLVRRELTRGRQAYVVAPLVEESEQLQDVVSATELKQRLDDQFAGFAVGLLHGRMNGRDKDEVMRRFLSGELKVLVSTTVIEVGIDVPNATVMLIYHAERFGLAQLHQLRGRVGRGEWQSYCVLLSDARSDIAKQRLETMVETTDGFLIAQRDLELRGPGEFLGVRQSGLPEFAVGDLGQDFKIMEVARDEAAAAIAGPDFWLLPSFSKLREALQRASDRAFYKD